MLKIQKLPSSIITQLCIFACQRQVKLSAIPMSSQVPFSLRIFVADGDPDGLRLVERSNWIGKAIMFPRALYTQVRGRPEFQQTGVYLLLGPRTQGDGEMLYIGEGDP